MVMVSGNSPGAKANPTPAMTQVDLSDDNDAQDGPPSDPESMGSLNEKVAVLEARIAQIEEILKKDHELLEQDHELLARIRESTRSQRRSAEIRLGL
ncbi:hypothetical protein BH23VER1_BH23VER1_00540 [soil metagenome]